VLPLGLSTFGRHSVIELVLTEIDLSSHSPCFSTTVGGGGVAVKEDNSPSQISGSDNKQYYRSSLSEKPGRHSLFQSVFSLQGDSPSLPGTSDSTGSKKIQMRTTPKKPDGIKSY
jgi:hypothetical protein